MGLVDSTEEKPDLAQLQKEAAERGERQNEERNAARKARQVRLGHVEAPKEEKPKAKAKAAAEPEPE